MTEKELKDIVKKHNKYAKNLGSKSEEVKRAIALTKNKRISKESYTIVQGLWLNSKVLESNRSIDILYICPGNIYTDESKKKIERLIEVSNRIVVVSSKVIERISSKEKDIGVVSIVKIPRINLDDLKIGEESIVLVLDSLEIIGNIGTIIRTAEGASVDGVILCNKKAGLNNQKIISASQGMVFNVPVIEENKENIEKWLRKNNYTLYYADTLAGKTYYDQEYNRRTVIVMGNERYGINKEWYEIEHKEVYIPMLGNIDSLNVAVATSIITYEVRKQFELKKIKNIE